MVFEITHLTPVVFGADAYQQTGKKLKELGATKVICICDEGIRATGIVDKVIETVVAEGIKVVVFDGVLPDPPDTIVDAAGELGRKENADAILGIGGGSCLDTAKAVNVLLTNPGSVQKYFDPTVMQNPGKPLVLIPTTAGTGTEVTKFAVLSNTKTGLKQGFMSKNCIPTLAIVDPALLVKLPPSLTASTGMDTFAHAAESYTSGWSNDMSDVLSLDAIKTVVKYLPIAVQDGSNLEARTKVSFACVCAGYAFGDNGVHFGHAIAHTLGAKYHIPHGTLCALALPIVMKYVSDVMPDKVRTIGKAMGLNLQDNLSNQEVGNAVADAIRKLNKELGIPSLKELKIPETGLDEVAKICLTDPCYLPMPKKLTQEEILKFLQEEFAL